MSYSPSIDISSTIATILGTTVGGTSDWSVYVGKEPTSPIRVCTCYLTGGYPSDPKWLIDYPTMQIRVRGNSNDYLLVEQKLQLLKDKLLGKSAFTQNSNYYVGVWEESPISFLHFTDDNNYPIFYWNIRLIVEPISGNSPNRSDF